MPSPLSLGADALSRRKFLQSTAAAGATVLATPLVHAGVSEVGAGIKIGLIGCGGRGSGAVLDAVGAAYHSIYPDVGYHEETLAEGATARNKGIEVVALADVFADRIERCRGNLRPLGLDVSDEHCFVGFDAYQQLLAISEINYVILATPPHFRPVQFEAAIEAGKNVFMEKPAAVDAPGVRKIIEAGKLASEKGLGVAAGTQRRHEAPYRETIRRVQDGAIGDLLYGKCYWNGSQVWVINRQPGWSDLEWQIRNWNHFTWLSGDHVVEQHVHNLDVMNWVLDAHPIRAVAGLGGRQVRTGEVHGNVFDHFAVEFEYPNGVSMFSQCRQINDCKTIIGEEVHGTLGMSNCKNRITPRDGKPWRFRKRTPGGYQAEHEHLIESIRSGSPINEAQAIAESTMTGILAREACYSGGEVRWDDAIASDVSRGPEAYDFSAPIPIADVPMPGRYELG